MVLDFCLVCGGSVGDLSGVGGVVGKHNECKTPEHHPSSSVFLIFANFLVLKVCSEKTETEATQSNLFLSFSKPFQGLSEAFSTSLQKRC
jgi:hypothetical protein